jgi:acid phosphatase
MLPLRRLALILCLLCLLASASAHAAGTPISTVRPVGVGLPILDNSEGLQAGDSDALIAALREYRNSGRYTRDLQKVNRAAARSLRRQLARRSPAVRRPAIVLDIDETALSNWATLSAGDFGAKPVDEALAARPDPAIPSTLALYREARRRGVAVFFITGRSPQARAFTVRNLRDAGYDRGWAGAYFRPRNRQTTPFKSGARARIERRGHTILVNVGDQQSDLAGGHARRAFKLPNPFYFIPGFQRP